MSSLTITPARESADASGRRKIEKVEFAGHEFAIAYNESRTRLYILDADGDSLASVESVAVARNQIRDIHGPAAVRRAALTQKNDDADDVMLAAEANAVRFVAEGGPLHGDSLQIPRNYCQRWGDAADCTASAHPTTFAYRVTVGDVDVVHNYVVDWETRTLKYRGIDGFAASAN